MREPFLKFQACIGPCTKIVISPCIKQENSNIHNELEIEM